VQREAVAVAVSTQVTIVEQAVQVVHHQLLRESRNSRAVQADRRRSMQHQPEPTAATETPQQRTNSVAVRVVEAVGLAATHPATVGQAATAERMAAGPVVAGERRTDRHQEQVAMAGKGL
jgi:hypothetical protein